MNALLDTASWALILGILSPLLISVVQQPQWTARTRSLITVGASVVIGLLTVLANGLDLSKGLLGVVALVFVASNTAYKALWKPTGVSPVIELATSRFYKGRHVADEEKAA